jgi:hypothetical protein
MSEIIYLVYSWLSYTAPSLCEAFIKLIRFFYNSNMKCDAFIAVENISSGDTFFVAVEIFISN